MTTKTHFETRAIQATEPHEDQTGSVANAIYPSTTFKRETDGSYQSGFIYTRDDNPNRQLLEQALAELEGGSRAFAFASGMAAISAMLQTLQCGDHVILPDDAYYSVHAAAKEVFERWGLTHSLVDMTDLNAVRSAINEQTRLIWLESPSNPLLKVSDIRTVTQLAHQHNALCVVDNTWCTPVLQQPLALGADAVMYSTTKYFGGHSDCLSGALVLNPKAPEELTTRLKHIQKLSGAVPSPFDCWLITRGIKTLKLRLMQQTTNASQLAGFLDQHPAIDAVHYPGLTSHPQHAIAAAQMTHGFGAMMSVQYADKASSMALTGRLKLFTAATSLGGVESLIEHRKSVEGDASLTPDNLLRISVGIEHIDDLIADWTDALNG
ncbi:trans-sulfuration enzyme family protein [Marinicella sediminis]|uniref:Trans-sulfuration enzyme family protein n=1 Tax=Marinicella sediminis TaxID=1792834 RepID=A0ABV7JAX8_9GAMM|nr:aminotransferase class I/II-fold pyridoxal phosphate-dependent enzyme [Marinicella sediminis]